MQNWLPTYSNGEELEEEERQRENILIIFIYLICSYNNELKEFEHSFTYLVTYVKIAKVIKEN